MAKVNKTQMTDWSNGNIVTEEGLEKDLEILRVGLNATDDTIIANKTGTDNHKNSAVLDHPDGSVVTAKLANGAVTTAKIVDGDVVTSKIADLGVTTEKIANLSVTNQKLSDNAVSEVNIIDGAVTTTKIADTSVNTNKLADGSVTESKLSTGSVTSAKLGSFAVTSSKINDLAVSTDKIANNAVTSAKIADGSVGNSEIASGSVTNEKLSTDVQTSISTNTADISYLKGKYGSGVATAINDYTWTATEGQTLFTLPDGQVYGPNSNTLEVIVGGVPQTTGVTESSMTTFTLAEGVPLGTKVYARWFQGVELSSELLPSVTDLPGYTENVSDKIGILSDSVDEHAETLGNLSNYATPQMHGGTGDGVADDSTPILNADATGKRVVFPQGRYLFKSNTNPTFSGGVDLINANVDGQNYQDILAFDADKKTLVGLHHNHLQSTTITSPITNGKIVEAPLSKAYIPSAVDIIAHWYQDFGLEYTRNGGGGSTWYTWAWNHVGSAGYDPSRHPLLGWYRGDDANVMDWQCYWLREYGVSTLCFNPSAGVNVSTWSTPTDRYHYLYQLFNNVKNFKGLKYILWGAYDGVDATDIQSKWEYLIDNVYLPYRNFKTIEKNGKLYPVIYCFEGATLFTNLGNTATAFNNFASALATKFKNAGYGGIALFMRHPKSITSLSRYDLENLDVLYFTADYGGHGGILSHYTVSDALTYSDMVNSYVPYHKNPTWVVSTAYNIGDKVVWNGTIYSCTTAHTSTANDCPGTGKNQTTYWTTLELVSRNIQCIANSKYAISPHPSQGNGYWKAAGNTPALFEKWLRKAIDYAISDDSPRMIMIYNVSEWAEGGPGLQPNRQDGFGYLEAIKNALMGYGVVVNNQYPDKVKSMNTIFITATSTITPSRETLRLTTDFGRTLTSVPTIKAGKDGQRLKLMNTNASYTITLQDNATLAGSNLFLTASTVVLGPYDSIELEYVDGKGWVQIGNPVNVL